ncbi:Hsp20 family protein [Paracoccaceae bacterium]|nr:Hsp20 family protein [Paracoccaceae bacterium]
MSFLSSPYMSSFVGFESLFDEIERMSSVKQSSYPAYDIKKISNNSFLIVLALAGFSTNDLMIEATSSELVIYGNGDKNNQREYIHKGIAKRAFTKTFRLADNVVVDGAEFKDGLLSIHLHRDEPRKEVPRKIFIKS